MKTKIIIEVETPDANGTNTLPEEGQTEEDFEGSPEKEKELKDFREEYAKDLHGYVVRQIKEFVDPESDGLIESIMESDYGIEAWDELKEYGIKIKVEEDKDHKQQKAAA